MRAEPPDDWSRAQRALHWTIAALVLTAAPMGVAMVGVPFRELLLKFVLYQLHKTVGIAVFLLVLMQLSLHFRRGRAAWSDTMPVLQRRIAAGIHMGIFALLCVVPALGYLTAATAPARIPTLFLGILPVPHVVGAHAEMFAVLRRGHMVLAAVLVALASGHAAMAVFHHLRGEDILARMCRNIPRRAKEDRIPSGARNPGIRAG